jgi:hypothetical protein
VTCIAAVYCDDFQASSGTCCRLHCPLRGTVVAREMKTSCEEYIKKAPFHGLKECLPLLPSITLSRVNTQLCSILPLVSIPVRSLASLQPQPTTAPPGGPLTCMAMRRSRLDNGAPGYIPVPAGRFRLGGRNGNDLFCVPSRLVHHTIRGCKLGPYSPSHLHASPRFLDSSENCPLPFLDCYTETARTFYPCPPATVEPTPQFNLEIGPKSLKSSEHISFFFVVCSQAPCDSNTDDVREQRDQDEARCKPGGQGRSGALTTTGAVGII